MPAVTRRSRRVAGLSPSTATTPPAPAPALVDTATSKRPGFRNTSTRAATTPKRVVRAKKRAVEAAPEATRGPAKRARPSTKTNTNQPAAKGDTPNEQIRIEGEANTTSSAVGTGASICTKAPTPVAVNSETQDNRPESTPTLEDEQPAATPSRLSSFFTNIFRTGGTPKPPTSAATTPRVQHEEAAPRYSFAHFSYTPSRLGTSTDTGRRSHTHRTPTLRSPIRGQSEARPEPIQIATVPTPSCEGNPPGTSLLAVSSASPASQLLSLSSLTASQNDDANAIYFVVSIIDKFPKNQKTDLIKVFEAIAAWQSNNRDSPLPSVSDLQKFLDDNALPLTQDKNTPTSSHSAPNQPAPKAVMEPESFSSTFRAPSPNGPYSSDDDSEMEDGVTAKIIPAIVKSAGKPYVAIPPTPKVFSNTFRAPSPNNPDGWSSDSEMSEDEPELPAEIANTPCPKAGTKRFSRSRSSSLTNGNVTKAPSIFDRSHITANTTFGASCRAPTVESDEEPETPKSTSPHITPFVRTPALRSPLKGKSNAHREAPMAKSLMHSNFIGYTEGQGINIKLAINQDIVDDFNNRAEMRDSNWVKQDGIETEIYELASMGSFDNELKEFELRRMQEKADREEGAMDVDTILEDEDVDMDRIYEEKDATDFDVERIKGSSFAEVVDAIPEEEFEEL